MGELDYRVKTTVHSGRFDHPKLPESAHQFACVNSIAIPVACIRIESSQAICGEAICRASGAIDQYKWPENAHFEKISIAGLRLDDRLAKSLTPKLRVGWNKLQPKGRVDLIDAAMRYEHGQWMTDAIVDCKGVDIRFNKFPYPAEQVVGRVHVKDNVARTGKNPLTGRIGGRRFQCAFQLPTKPEVVTEKAFVIATDGPIAIDRTLLSSLSHPLGNQKPA